MNKKKRLEEIVDTHAKSEHVKHHDPLEFIHNHVLLVVFLAVSVVFMSFIFMISTPSEPGITANAVLIDYSALAPDWNLKESITGFVDGVRDSESRSYVLLTFYTFWIIVFAVVNAMMLEKERPK